MTKSLSLVCSYCHHLNYGIIFRPSDAVSTFTCETCGNENYIRSPVDELVYKVAETAIELNREALEKLGDL